MKKITGLAATMALGLAFCGFCTGCAAGVKQSTEAPSVPTASVSADSDYKVILNPGIHVNGTTKATIEAEAKVTKADADVYFVENGYIANYTAGEELPKAQTTRSGVTFAGWRYAVDGVPTVVTTMPDVSKLTDNLYLYAHWTTGTGGNGGGGDVTNIPDIKATVTFTDGISVVIAFDKSNVPSDISVSDVKLHMWAATSLTGDFPGKALSGTINMEAASSAIQGMIVSFSSGSNREQTLDITDINFQNGYTYVFSYDDWIWGQSQKFSYTLTEIAPAA